MDRSRPIREREDAARKLADESDQYAAWQALCALLRDEGQDTALRCAVAGVLPRCNRYAAVNQLARRFVDVKVRRAAVEAIRSLGPVRGEMEGRLLQELDRLRRRDPTAFMSNAAGTYGGDPRLLAYLLEAICDPDPEIRAAGAMALCQIGDGDRGLALADDPVETVRARLCEGLGFYQEERGAQALFRLMGDPEPEVSRQAKKALRFLHLLPRAELLAANQRSDQESDLRRLLRQISLKRLGREQVALDMPDAMVQAGWLGEPGASEQAIRTAEERIGRRLPPSYRDFLVEANGFHHISPFIYKIFSASEIDWFRTLEPDWIEAYAATEEDDMSAEDHARNRSDGVWFRRAYLADCLQISEVGDSAVVLLNPEVQTDDGEWETWFFANWIPGAYRYPSFREFVVKEAKSAL